MSGVVGFKFFLVFSRGRSVQFLDLSFEILGYHGKILGCHGKIFSS
jgi:hypothetical protein